jgi:predicted PurR-regulated permease PerM
MAGDEEARALAEVVTANAGTDALAHHGIVRSAAAGASVERPFGLRGQPLAQRSPFLVGFKAALGGAVAVLLVAAMMRASSVLVLLVLALFVAIGLDPLVARFVDRGWSRNTAVAVVVLGALTVLGGFIASAVPALTTEYGHMSRQVPQLLHQLQQRHDAIGGAARNVTLSGSTVSRVVSFQGVLTAGRTLVSAVVSTLTVIVLVIYFLANLPAMKTAAYRLLPRRRRARVGLLTDGMLALVGGYLLGNLITSGVAGIATFLFLSAIGVPFAVFLGLLVAVFDLIPMIGAPVAGVLVSLVALSESLPKAIAVATFTLVFRLLEDYLLAPRVMRRTVEVEPMVTVLAVLMGGALLGIVGALIAVPVAAALDLLRREVLHPRMDRA